LLLIRRFKVPYSWATSQEASCRVCSVLSGNEGLSGQ
jgi:hypothetical protein